MIILKIGGSILTEKDSAKPEVDYESLERIAGEIEKALYSDEMSTAILQQKSTESESLLKGMNTFRKSLDSPRFKTM